jgi:ferredoxin
MIFYFTGTGNSLMVARAIAEGLEDSNVIHVSRTEDFENIPTPERIGLIFPVYNGGPPLIVMNTLASLKKHKDSYIFSVATHAGGPDMVLSILRDELQKIGLELSAGFTLYAPNNYVIGYRPPSKRSIESTLTRIDQIIPDIVHVVKNKETHLQASDFPSGSYKGHDKFLSEVNYKDERFWITEDCTECGTCERVCPAQNIVVADGTVEWLHRCELCLACINWCPESVIRYGKETHSRGHYTNPRVSVEDMIKIDG